MSNYRYKLTSGLVGQTRYRVDTASGSDTPATIVTPNDGFAIAGSIVRSDYEGGGVEFNGTAATLYLKPLNADGTLVGSGTVTATGALLNDAGPTPNVGVTALAAQSGAVVLDLSRSNVFTVALTGNVTGWSFTNLGRSGQEVEVHFVQDATGSRTLAGADASIKLAGGTITLTTTASKRDVLRFRQIAGVFYEQSRSLAQ